MTKDLQFSMMKVCFKIFNDNLHELFVLCYTSRKAMSYKLRAQNEICKQHCFTVKKNFVKRTNEKIKRKDFQIAKLKAKLITQRLLIKI